MSDAILSFKLGPVQPFIESARTLRDLWSGSYLLSWLTAHGMKPLIEKYGYAAFVTPHVSEDNPLLRAVMSGTGTGDEAATLACLPHTFAAEVEWDQRDAIMKEVEDAVRNAWKDIANAVRNALRDRVGDRMKPFLDSPTWEQQVANYFEITVVVRPNGDVPPASEDWSETEWKQLGELLEMRRNVRHVPVNTPQPDARGRFPVKCSQLGSLEQMGPADFEESKRYWASLTRLKAGKKNAPGWDGLHGTRLQSSDKLCAVALVKRFMWPAYFAETPDKRLTNRLGVHVHKLRLTDTATMAAQRWLAEGEVKIDPQVEWQAGHWSGQWLHWATPEEDDDAPCPPSVWDRIQAKKRGSKPPTYFALMHLDGDNMGQFFKGNRERLRATSEALTKFSAGVQGIVKGHQGELIYAGGDDVLAFLPTETAIACARRLHEEFGKAFGKALPDATLSGGIAVVHYKEDLRFALGQVRAAEKAAKKIARKGTNPKAKDALALTICKRSGERATVVNSPAYRTSFDRSPIPSHRNISSRAARASCSSWKMRWTCAARGSITRGSDWT